MAAAVSPSTDNSTSSMLHTSQYRSSARLAIRSSITHSPFLRTPPRPARAGQPGTPLTVNTTPHQLASSRRLPDQGPAVEPLAGPVDEMPSEHRPITLEGPAVAAGGQHNDGSPT